jgi:hypothetical protein
MPRPIAVGIVVLALTAPVAACNSDDGATDTTVASTTSASTTATPTTVAPTPTTEPPTTEPSSTGTTDTSVPDPGDDPYVREVVETLASDELAGRNNGTPESLAAQGYLTGKLAEFAQPFSDAAGPPGYVQTFAAGGNLLGVIPGGDLAEQYVVVGAHYDHLGSGDDCARIEGVDDDICNGATDNAAGVAAALAIGRSIAADPQPPRRTVVIALWDAEEDGLEGSDAFLDAALLPAEAIVGYVNFDIQGTSISPALTGVTVMVGAETGGPNLMAAARAATQASSLDTVALSLLFGQGRSDHANFVTAGVPSVFLTDATPPCYHTVGDDITIVDFPKLTQQIRTAEALTRELMDTDAAPVLDATAPPATHDDAVALLDIVQQAEPDFGRFSDGDEAAARRYLADLQAIVDAGPDAFDDTKMGILLSGAVTMVQAWASGPCEPFLG